LYQIINISINKILVPYSVNRVTSSLAGYKFGLSYQQTTPSDLVFSPPKFNFSQVKFSGDLNYNIIYEGIGTVYTTTYDFNLTMNTINGTVYTGYYIKS